VRDATLELRRSSAQPTARRLATAIAALAIAGCAAFEERLIVRRTGETVTIEGEREGRLITVQREPVRLSDCRVVETTGVNGARAEEVWRVTTISADASVAEIRYGETPGGYAQVTPPIGRPPELRPGERYRVECLGPRWLFSSFRAPEKK
jgi:hypothetical protein